MTSHGKLATTIALGFLKVLHAFPSSSISSTVLSTPSANFQPSRSLHLRVFSFFQPDGPPLQSSFASPHCLVSLCTAPYYPRFL